MAGRGRLPDLPTQLRRREWRRYRRPPRHHRAVCRTSCELGVDAIWLSPFYPSPLADGGYDITDYRDVDPRFGTLERLRRPGRAGASRTSGSSIDIVPNHTSEQHPWFLAAIAAGPGAPERERYIFRPGRDLGVSDAPSDWRSHFGGSAWERLPDGEWYCHLFAREQPDLNWDNPEVRQYFLDTLRFWADRGVDGFRVDVAHALAKDLSEPLRSQPHLDRDLPLDGTDPLYDRDEVHDIYRSWRTVFNEYDPPRMAVAETWHPTSARTYLYARPDRARSGLRLLPAQNRLERGALRPRHPAVHGGPPGRRRRPHVGSVQPRRSPTRHPLRPTGRCTTWTRGYSGTARNPRSTPTSPAGERGRPR